MKITYRAWKPGPEAMTDILRAEQICASYAAQGYDLTLRQLYYQFVSRGWIVNTERSYKRLGSIVSQARMAGLLDWDYIVDRGRLLKSVTHRETPAEIINDAARAYRIDKWADQPRRVEVWVEKEALAGVIGRAATRNDVAFFACKGYGSTSVMWEAAQRLSGYLDNDQDVTILHLGDHDPSGVDMTRDITARLLTFLEEDHHDAEDRLEIHRIALTWDQVQTYNPPPNPTKVTDSRAPKYIAAFGHESWELDALDPATLDALIETNILALRDDGLYTHQEAVEQRHRELLAAASARWTEVAEYLS